MAETDLILAAKTTLITPNQVEGEIGPLTADGEGRLRVTGDIKEFPVTSGDVNVTGVANAFVVDVREAASMVLHMKNTGTASMTTGIHVFEGSVDSTDGVDGTWFAIQGARTNSNTVETGRQTATLAAGVASAYAWEFSVAAIRYFRVRATTNTMTNSIATWTAVRSSYALEATPAIQDHGITGTVQVAGTISANPPVGTTIAFESAASTNLTLDVAAPRTLTEVTAFNPTATAAYLKLYNKITQPTLASDVPFLTIPIPANGFVNIDFGILGKRFSLGIAHAITANAVKTDATASVSGIQIGLTYVNN